MGDDDTAVRRSLSAEHVLALSRASSLGLGFTQLDRFWVDESAAIARDPQPASQRSRAESLTILGDEMSRQLGELGKLGPALTAAARAMSDEAKTLSDEWPPAVVRTTDPNLRTVTAAPGPVREVIPAVGKAIINGISQPSFPEFIDQTVKALSSQTGVPAKVIQQGAEALIRGDISASSVVESIGAAVSEAGIPLPPGFAEAASIFTQAVSAAHGGGGDGLHLLPALGGLIGAAFGLPALGSAIGSIIEWIAHRVLAEDESDT